MRCIILLALFIPSVSFPYWDSIVDIDGIYLISSDYEIWSVDNSSNIDEVWRKDDRIYISEFKERKDIRAKIINIETNTYAYFTKEKNCEIIVPEYDPKTYVECHFQDFDFRE